MTDLEELRLEIKLLKERIAALEARPVYLPCLNAPVFPAYPTYPPIQPMCNQPFTTSGALNTSVK